MTYTIVIGYTGTRGPDDLHIFEFWTWLYYIDVV